MPMRKGRQFDVKHREFVLDDLDRAILRELPMVGTKIGKYLNDGRTVKQLAKAVDPVIGTYTYGGRLNAMRYQGYVTGAKGSNVHEWVWQATEAGKKVVGQRVTPSEPTGK